MNIFENILKEDFIRINNLYLKNSRSRLTNIENEICELSKNIEFHFTGEKRFSYKIPYFISIKNVLNYNEEIEIFNSFDVIREYSGDKYLIYENVNKYLKHKGVKKRIGEFKNHDEKIIRIGTISKFNTYIRKLERIKLNKEIHNKLLEKLINPFIESFTKILQPEFDFFDFKHNVKTNFSFTFIEFEKTNYQKKLLKKHLLNNNFLDYFKLNINSDDKRLFEEIKLEELIMCQTEFHNCIIETGSYFDYEVYGDKPFFFKKIISSI